MSSIVDKREFFANKFGPGPLLEHHTTTMLFRDPPDHDRLRALVNPFFSQSLISILRPMVEARVAELVAFARDRRQIDFVNEIAFPLTIFMICRILGIPPEDARIVERLGRCILAPLNPSVESSVISAGHAAAAEFKDYLLDYVNVARRRSRIDQKQDIISALVAAERSGGQISEAEILHMCVLMLNGGHESTTNLISVSLKALIEDRRALVEIRSGEVSLSTAVEELIRFVSPLQLQGRRTTRRIPLSLGEISQDTEVIVAVGSANWDERVFTDPDRLNLRRKPNPHVGFGAGVHFCIGRALARLEASVVLPAFVRAFRSIEQNGAAPYRVSARFRGLGTLPLALDP